MRTTAHIILMLLTFGDDLNSQQNPNKEQYLLEAIAKVQGDFLTANFDQARKSVQTISEFDSLIRVAQGAWRSEAEENYPHLTNLRSDVFQWFLLTGERTVNQAKQRHLAVNYWLPAFVQEFTYYEQTPNPAKAFILRMNLRNMFLFSLMYDLPPQLWHQMNQVFQRSDALLTSYLSEVDSLNSRIRNDLEYLRYDLPNFSSLFHIRELIHNGKRVEALSKLGEAFNTNTNNANWLVTIGRNLADKFYTDRDKSRALETLDLLVTSVDVKVLGIDSIRARYTQFDPANGLARLEHLLTTKAGQSASIGESKVALTGTYKNLLTGSMLDLSSLRGKKVLIDFWATWCAPCRSEIPDLIKFQERHSNRDDFVFISVSGDPITSGATEQHVQQFVRLFGINYTVLLDDPNNSLSKRFNVRHWPTKMLLDPSGDILLGPTSDKILTAIEEMIIKQ